VTAAPDYNFKIEYEEPGEVAPPEVGARFIISSTRVTFPTRYLFENGAIELYEALGKALAQHTGG